MYEMKNTLEGNKANQTLQKKRSVNFKDILETIQNKTHRQKNWTLVSDGTQV